MELPRPTSTNQSDHTALGDHRSAAEGRITAQESMITLLERKHPLLGSRNAIPRTLTVIRPPSFSLGTIVSGIRTLVGYRDLLYTLTLFRLTVRYKQSILGWIWAALHPLAMMMVYTLVFSRVAKVRSEGAPYPLFVFSALLPWIFFSGAVSNAVNGLAGHANLLTKLYFPREIIPLSYVFAALLDFAIACVILSGVMAYYGFSVSWKALYALPIVAILIAFTSAVALFLSSIQARFRDIAAALPVVLQVGVFATPVAYSLNSIPTRFQRLYLLNPIASLIENFRRVVTYRLAPDIPMLVTSGVITVCCLAVAYGYFKATESTMADVI
jgi:lipopolysaccharide transport system permease protein